MAEMDPRDVDIGDGCKRIEGAQQDLPQGHFVHDNMEITNPFSGIENCYFERTFDLECPEMPTSFHFRITFPGSRSPVASSVASVRRTDQRAGSVNLTFFVTVYGNIYQDEFARYRISDLGPGGVGRDVASFIFPSRLQEESNPRLEFSVTVLGCHGEQEGEEAVHTRDSEEIRLRRSDILSRVLRNPPITLPIEL